LTGWEEILDWYDKKMGNEGDLWHRSLIDPALIKLVGSVDKKSILDLGCGNGYLSRKFAREGGKVTAIDSSAGMLKNARARDSEKLLSIKYLQLDSAHLVTLKDDTFDIVFANMTLMDVEDAEGAICESSRVLKKGGRFIASISHPCFDNGTCSGWLVEKTIYKETVYRRITKYRTLFSEELPWRISSQEMRNTLSYHRPLSWYAQALSSAGLAITALEEPEPSKEFLEGEANGACFLEVPLHLVFEAKKL
jgi:ubiquinone/menaquinone biosynthesis C-methylase UbiE